jgi:tRNA-binding EMAP/Myf-like protein
MDDDVINAIERSQKEDVWDCYYFRRMVDTSEYKVGVVLENHHDQRTKKGGDSSKPLRVCKVDVGEEDKTLTVVTSASNVRKGSRVVVALAGSTVLGDNGDEIRVTKTSVGGVMSEGMLCDSKMLGWPGGAEGIAAQLPESYPLGSAPPATKPRPKEESPAAATSLGPVEDGLFAKRLTKEEKKKLSEEKREARKAGKEAKKTAEGN